MNTPCPHCGYCPTCGRANDRPQRTWPFTPYPQPYPWGHPWVTWGANSVSTPPGKYQTYLKNG